MARAKRFDRDRAEARRRYRAAQLATQDPIDETAADGSNAEAEDATATPRSGTRGRASLRGSAPKAAPAVPQGRLSLGQAFRAAFHQANLAEDLRGLPRLLVHKAVWIPIALSAASTLLVVVLGPKHPVASFAFTTFVLPPALAAVFITGFFVPRASYLAGGIVATVAAVFYSLFWVLAEQRLVPDVEPLEAGRVATEAIGAFSIAPISGVVFGAAAAWYRRFLYLSSPQRGRPNNAPRRRSGSTGRQGQRRR